MCIGSAAGRSVVTKSPPENWTMTDVQEGVADGKQLCEKLSPAIPSSQ